MNRKTPYSTGRRLLCYFNMQKMAKTNCPTGKSAMAWQHQFVFPHSIQLNVVWKFFFCWCRSRSSKQKYRWFPGHRSGVFRLIAFHLLRLFWGGHNKHFCRFGQLAGDAHRDNYAYSSAVDRAYPVRCRRRSIVDRASAISIEKTNILKNEIEFHQFERNCTRAPRIEYVCVCAWESQNMRVRLWYQTVYAIAWYNFSINRAINENIARILLSWRFGRVRSFNDDSFLCGYGIIFMCMQLLRSIVRWPMV